MKYSEAEKQIKSLSSKYDIDMSDRDFNIVYKGNRCNTHVSGHYRYYLHVEDNVAFSKFPFSNKLYMILSELAMTPLDERVEEKKHYIKIFDNMFGYLNISTLTGKMGVHDWDEIGSIKTRFTDKEIEQFKHREDIPLDWKKVKLEDAD